MSAVAPGVHFESYIIKEAKGLTFGIILKAEKVKVLKPSGSQTPNTFSSFFFFSFNEKSQFRYKKVQNGTHQVILLVHH